MHRRITAAFLAIWLAAGGAEALGQPGRQAGNYGPERRDVGVTVPSKIVEQQVTKLTTKVKWLSSLDEAKEQALKQKKPIFWLHALGDLDGIC
jgi:hypothetical protein